MKNSKPPPGRSALQAALEWKARHRNPAALQGVAAKASVGKISVETRPARPLTPAKPSPIAYALVDTYRQLDDPREIAGFWKKHKATLTSSNINEVVLSHIAAGKRLRGFVLTVLSQRTEP